VSATFCGEMMGEMKSFRLAMPKTLLGKVITGIVVLWFAVVLLWFAAEALAVLFPGLKPHLQPFLSDF